MHIGVISLMPDLFNALHYGVTGRALQRKIVSFKHWNPRDWANNAYRKIDDKPYGGGPGMVMMYQPIHAALCHARANMPENCKTIYVSPQGKTITQADLVQIANSQQPLLFLAGRYEGIDERIITNDIDEEWSLGDFVLSGGELAILVFMDAIIRLLKGSLNDEQSALNDSFMHGLLDHPQYTRPYSINGLDVPQVLLSGNHHDIAQFRRQQALGKTWIKRPDLLRKYTLTKNDKKLLDEFKEHI